MGLVYAEITLTNIEDLGLFRKGDVKEDAVRRITVNSLVDSGAYMMVIPGHIKLQLGLEVIDKREVDFADSSKRVCDIAKPIEIRFANRMAVINAFVLGNEVLLGAIPMEELDIVIDQLN